MCLVVDLYRVICAVIFGVHLHFTAYRKRAEISESVQSDAGSFVRCSVLWRSMTMEMHASVVVQRCALDAHNSAVQRVPVG